MTELGRLDPVIVKEEFQKLEKKIIELKEEAHHKDVHIDDLKSDLVWVIGTLRPLMDLIDEDEEESDEVVSCINEIISKHKLNAR